MAPSGGLYFPDLGKCLQGDEPLISWDDLFRTLLSHKFDDQSAVLSFYCDPRVLELLSQPYPHLPPTSPQAKSSFETKTAAINVSPSTSGTYDIEEIKSDAFWISDEVKIDQVEALRLVVLEWQQRPEKCMRQGFSDTELASLADALGTENLQSLRIVPESRFCRYEDDFESKHGRHLRIASQFLTDQVRMLAVSKVTLEEIIRQSTDKSPIAALSATIKQIDASIKAQSTSLDELQMCIDYAKTALDRLRNPHRWQVAEEIQAALSEDDTTCNLQSIAIAFQILLLRLRWSNMTTSAESLLSWLQFLSSLEYFGGFQSDVASQRDAIDEIRSATSYITLHLLDPSSIIAAMSDDQSTLSNKIHEYFSDRDVFGEIHDYMLSAAATCNVYASLGFLAWGLLLLEMRRTASGIREARESHQVQKAIDTAAAHDNNAGRRSSASSTSSGQQSIYEDLLERVHSSNIGEDSPSYIIKCALEGCATLGLVSQMSAETRTKDNVLASFQLQILQDLIAISIPVLGYAADIVTAQLSLVAPVDRAKRGQISIYEPEIAFIEDQFLMNSFFDTAAARFPYEILPFLRLCRSLAHAKVLDGDGTQYVTFRLHQLNSFTQAATKGFSYYSTIREDENANLVSLHHAVDMLASGQNKLLTHTNQQVDTVDMIPAQTIGEVISESVPPIIKWQHEFSGLCLIGKWLELYYKGVLALTLTSSEAAHDVVAEVIALLATLLKTTLDGSSDKETAQQACETILEETSSRLDQNTDCVFYVFELLERELQTFRRYSPAIYDTGILAACVEFLTVLSKIRPSQCWAGLHMSSIFGTGGSSGSLLSVVDAVEVPRQDFPFLHSCSRLYQTLVDLTLQQVLPKGQNHSQAWGAASRTNSRRVNELALLSYTSNMFPIFEAISTWTFTNWAQRSSIIANLATAFSQIVQLGFGVGDPQSSDAGPVAMYRPAANFLVESFSRIDDPESKTNTIVLNLATSFAQYEIDAVFMQQENEDVPKVLSLAALLVRHGLAFQHPSELFQKQFLDFFPILVRLPLIFANTHSLCYTLARNVLEGMTGNPVSSLLGRLGSVSAVAFINHLKLAVSAPSRVMVAPQIWRLFSLLVSREQQWLAIVLITGRPPKLAESTKQLSGLVLRGGPILNMALKLLINIVNLDPESTIGMLSFIVQAQLNWISVTDALNSEQDFFPALINYVARQRANASDEVESSLHNCIASQVTTIATAHLHHVVSSRNINAVKLFYPLFAWLTSNAIDVASYNTSLHKNLKKNISMKYSGFDISAMKRTRLVEAKYGDDYFYAVDIADRLLADDPHWKNDKSSNHSFSSELKRANANLSLVDSEVCLLNSFKHMCLDHRVFFSRDRDIQKTMAHIVTNSLQANMQSSSIDSIFENLAQIRLDLAVALMRQLLLSGAKGSDFVILLSNVWTAARIRNGSYELAIMNNDVKYWRSMLSVLLLSLRFHAEKKTRTSVINGQSGTTNTQIDPINATILEITSEIVGKGMRSITGSLHSQMRSKTKSASSDFVSVEAHDVFLLLNILQTILRLPSVGQISSQVAHCLISCGIVDSCLLLYSWSHVLNGKDGRNPPIYADASLRFIVSVSSLSTAAEEIAVEGTLSRLLTARVTQTLQHNHKGVLNMDKRSNTTLLYSLWSNGLLPLCLNILYAVGGGVAAEVSMFLNQFPAQLKRATMTFATMPQEREPSGDVLTLATASEAATLSLIAYILDSYRAAGASAGIDSTAILPLANFDEHRKSMAEDVRDVLQQDQALRVRRTLALTEQELTWQKSAENLLDKKIVAQLQQALACLTHEDEDEQS